MHRSTFVPEQWQLPPAELALAPDEVHVWRASLDQPAVATERLYTTLAQDEAARARRFRFARHRDHFVVARGVLRAILARYVHAGPAALRFRYGPRGKPALAEGRGDPPLSFNLSHSGELALCAVARGRELGIDVECTRPELAGEDIARRFFSPHEVGALLALPEDARPDAFFRCWTRKEAYIKARGDGLALALDSFDVTLAPGEPAALLRTQHEPADAARWSLRELPIDPGYAATVAVEGHGWQLKQWQWVPSC